MKRKLLIGFLIVLTALIAMNLELISYGIAQGRGQLKIIWNTIPIEDALTSEQFPDSLKSSLELVPEIREYAFRELGLVENQNYTTVYDQGGKEILWVVTACEPYSFEPVVWKFPVIGSFTYKGYFDIDKARDLVEELKGRGLDVSARSVSGWSTLGWFKDPVLSNMLLDEEGELANTIIHELTHGTLFIPDSMTFNENLASFIGHQGSIRLLEKKYGPDSPQAQDYLNKRKDSRLLSAHLVQAAKELDTLYKQLDYLPVSDKQIFKQGLIQRIVITMDSLSFTDPDRYAGIYEKYPPNNAFFISFLSYRERQAEFDIMLKNKFENDLKAFIDYWKGLYGS